MWSAIDVNPVETFDDIVENRNFNLLGAQNDPKIQAPWVYLTLTYVFYYKTCLNSDDHLKQINWYLWISS